MARAVAAILLAVQLLLTAGPLCHHHDDDAHAAGDHQTCPHCLVLRQPALPAAPRALAVVEVPLGRADRDADAEQSYFVAHDPPSIRGPPAPLAGGQVSFRAS